MLHKYYLVDIDKKVTTKAKAKFRSYRKAIKCIQCMLQQLGQRGQCSATAQRAIATSKHTRKCDSFIYVCVLNSIFVYVCVCVRLDNRNESHRCCNRICSGKHTASLTTFDVATNAVAIYCRYSNGFA